MDTGTTMHLLTQVGMSFLLAAGASGPSNASNRDILIAEDSPFVQTAFVRAYLERLASLLVSGDGNVLSYVSEGLPDAEESFYFTRKDPESECVVTSIRLATAFRPVYGAAYERQQRRGNLHEQTEAEPPPVDKKVAPLASKECKRVVTVWRAAVSRLRTLSDWINQDDDCRSTTSGCSHIYPVPHARIRIAHFACYPDVGNGPGYMVVTKASGGWLQLEALARSIVAYVRAQDAKARDDAHALVLDALHKAEQTYVHD